MPASPMDILQTRLARSYHYDHRCFTGLGINTKEMKNAIRFTIILAVFGWMNIATTPNIFYPCETQINSFIHKDTLTSDYYFMTSHDTVIIRAYKDTLWESKTLEICKILRDSCQINNYKILIVDTSYNVPTWNTPYGNLIYFRKCQ